MKISLTGSNGLLGKAIIRECYARGWPITPISRELIDPKNLNQLRGLISGYDILIHAAANTNVEQCEIEPLICYRDNTFLTEIISEAANQCGIKIVYISSTGVYGNYQDTPYHEYDNIVPTTHHHRAKWLGEQAVLCYSNSLVIRTGWLFGGNPENRKNFVARRVEEALGTKDYIESNSQQFGCPSYVNDVTNQLLRLIEDNRIGVFNCVNTGVASRYDYVRKIIEITRLDREVRPSSAASFNRKANVSHNESALNLKADYLGYEKMPHWEESLEKYLKTELFDWLQVQKGTI